MGGPERAPERLGSHQPVGIERVPPEPDGWYPAARLVVHRCHDRASLSKVACVRAAVGFTRNYIGKQFAFAPIAEVFIGFGLVLGLGMFMIHNSI